jgi:hypothetical protein
MAQRFIGIRHRVKATKEGEAKPTQLAIAQDGKVKVCDLSADIDELDWVRGLYPTHYREVVPEEDLTKFIPRHVTWRKLDECESHEAFPKGLVRKLDDTWFIASKVPDRFDGLQKGDTVAMLLGGSGDRLAFALSRRGQNIGAEVMRVPAFRFLKERDKDKDAELLVETVQITPAIFYLTRPRDRNIILVIERYRARMDSMKARIACEQRIFSNLVGRIFCQPDGVFAEGDIEVMYNDAKANDAILAALLKEEGKRKRELESALEELDIFQKLFKPLTGIGPSIAGRIIAAVQDIRRFSREAAFKKFCGVHVMLDGRFPRRREGEKSDWQPDARQAMYLLADQFNRQQEKTEWGRKLLAYKVSLRATHPEVVTGENGKKKYTNGHIHKMAIWRTLTKFAEWLFKEWWKLEKDQPTQ